MRNANAGADEISRICRTLSSSGRVAAAAGGGVQVGNGWCYWFDSCNEQHPCCRHL